MESNCEMCGGMIFVVDTDGPDFEGQIVWAHVFPGRHGCDDPSPVSQETRQVRGHWVIRVDFGQSGVNGGEWEATAFPSSDLDDQLHWASSDVHTLMAAIGRDMADLMEGVS